MSHSTYPSWEPVQPAGYAPPHPSGYPAQPGHPGWQMTGYGLASIAVTMRYAPIAFLFAIFKPVLTVDGQRIRAGWKRRVVVPVDPGSHLVHAHVPYLIPPRVGNADLPVEVDPGQTVSLEYRAPVVVFLRGALGAPPQRYPGLAVAVVINAIALVAVLAAGVFTFAGPGARPGFALPAGNVPSAESYEVPKFPVAPTGPAVPDFPGPAGSADGPALRPDAPARKVTGATFGADEDTRTMAHDGWPFAFRAPATWKCVPGKIDLPGTEAWVCLNERNSAAERAGIILRKCPSGCSAADRRTLDEQWFVDTGGLKRADAGTRFRQTAKNPDGKYQLELSHYFTDPATGVKYQVGVDARTTPAKKPAAQKVVNEILSQTTF